MASALEATPCVTMASLYHTYSQKNKDDKNSARATTFTCFLKLPIETRREIWKWVAHLVRNVDIQIHRPTTRRRVRNHRYRDPHVGRLYFYYSSTPVPSVLHVCQESRNESLKYYTLDFGIPQDVNREAAPPKFYINWAIDRLVLFDTSVEMSDLVSKIKTNKLAKIAIQIGETWVDTNQPNRVAYQISDASALYQFNRNWLWKASIQECYLFSFEAFGNSVPTWELLSHMQPLTFRNPDQSLSNYQDAKNNVIQESPHISVMEKVLVHDPKLI